MLYLLTFGVPGLRLQGTPSVLVLGGVALVLTYGGYLAEVFRAGIESVHPSQRAAARSLGLTYRQTMRHVVLPQAVRRVAPPLLNDLVALQKDVGLISLAGPDRRDPGRADRDRRDLQLHAVRRGRGAVRAARDPADRGHRLGDAAGGAPPVAEADRHDAPCCRMPTGVPQGVRAAHVGAATASTSTSPSTRWSA